MTELKATPGPWTAENESVYALVDTKPEDRRPGWPDKVNRMSISVTMYPRQAHCEPGEAEANAHLIAAAPKLYEALAAMVDDLLNNDGLDARAIAKHAGQTALRQARGETE